MKLTMSIGSWERKDTLEALEKKGVNYTKRSDDDNDYDYFVYFESIEQALEVAEELKTDLVLCAGNTEEKGRAFFFSGYYEG